MRWIIRLAHASGFAWLVGYLYSKLGCQTPSDWHECLTHGHEFFRRVGKTGFICVRCEQGRMRKRYGYD